MKRVLIPISARLPPGCEEGPAPKLFTPPHRRENSSRVGAPGNQRPAPGQLPAAHQAPRPEKDPGVVLVSCCRSNDEKPQLPSIIAPGGPKFNISSNAHWLRPHFNMYAYNGTGGTSNATYLNMSSISIVAERVDN